MVFLYLFKYSLSTPKVSGISLLDPERVNRIDPARPQGRQKTRQKGDGMGSPGGDGRAGFRRRLGAAQAGGRDVDAGIRA